MEPRSFKAASKTKYHHYIPRFILRKFLEVEGPPKNVRERNKGYWKAREQGIETELLTVYDLSTKTLQHRPVAKIFGEKNLYNDMTDGISRNVEEKLSKLENQAAQIIKSIENSSQKGSFTLTRESLGLLRKFLYVMHFRTTAVRDRYFGEKREEHMEDWINHYMRQHGLHSYQDVWLGGLSYVMDTPHSHIVREGELTGAKYPSRQWHEMWSTRLDPAINYFAMDYEGLANSHYLGIWEAAPGTEFVMGNNSFGLWEGLLINTRSFAHMLLSSHGGTQIHRLFIVTPKLALVLRYTCAQLLSRTGWEIKSSLYNIDISNPRVRWHGSPFGVFRDHKEARQYRVTNIALKDTYTFSTTKLTVEQTRAVNNVILLNIPDNGNLVFSSKSRGLDEVRKHIATPVIEANRGDPHKRYFPLVVTLTRHLNIDIPQELEADRRLRVALEGSRMVFRSDWDELHWFYRAMTADPKQQHPMALEMRIRLFHAKNYLKSLIMMDDGADADAEMQQSQMRHVVDSLSTEDSTRVLGYTSMLINLLLDSESTTKGTRAATIKGAMIVGIIQWIVKENPAFMKSIAGDDVYSRLTQPGDATTKKLINGAGVKSSLGPAWHARLAAGESNLSHSHRTAAEVQTQSTYRSDTRTIQSLTDLVDLPVQYGILDSSWGNNPSTPDWEEAEDIFQDLIRVEKVKTADPSSLSNKTLDLFFFVFFISVLSVYIPHTN